MPRLDYHPPKVARIFLMHRKAWTRGQGERAALFPSAPKACSHAAVQDSAARLMNQFFTTTTRRPGTLGNLRSSCKEAAKFMGQAALTNRSLDPRTFALRVL
jgi:hypothetical protein